MFKQIQFEKETILAEWGNIHPTLLKVFWTLLQVWPSNVVVRITSMNRSTREDDRLGASGIHSAGPPWRAIDVGGSDLEQSHLDAIADFVNTVWKYDTNRPTLKVAVSQLHGTGKHIHLQVHKRTERNLNG